MPPTPNSFTVPRHEPGFTISQPADGLTLTYLGSIASGLSAIELKLSARASRRHDCATAVALGAISDALGSVNAAGRALLGDVAAPCRYSGQGVAP
jgi:hypothetical protein